MIAVDTNVLIYAHREEMPLHADALGLLRALAEGADPWGLPVPCLAELVRVVTHPRIFCPPSSLPVAFEFLERLLESPSARLLLPGDDLLARLRSTAEQAGAAGNLAFDAQIAAICLASGATELVTLDRDFARFTGLAPRGLDR